VVGQRGSGGVVTIALAATRRKTWSVSFQEWSAYKESTFAAGAQTERRGGAWAGEGHTWRLYLTG
jgi:hypothetical protein